MSDKIPVILEKVINIEDKIECVNMRLEKLESLRDRVVVLETMSISHDCDIKACKSGLETMSKMVGSLGWKGMVILFGVVTQLALFIFNVYTVRQAQQSDYLKPHIQNTTTVK
jgi:hypothetical protein